MLSLACTLIRLIVLYISLIRREICEGHRNPRSVFCRNTELPTCPQHFVQGVVELYTPKFYITYCQLSSLVLLLRFVYLQIWWATTVQISSFLEIDMHCLEMATSFMFLVFGCLFWSLIKILTFFFSKLSSLIKIYSKNSDAVGSLWY